MNRILASVTTLEQHLSAVVAASSNMSDFSRFQNAQ
jgi:hypothetical protein